MKNVPKCRMCFLMGVIAAKWCINHSHQRIRVHLPASKKSLASELKDLFGGTLHVIKRPGKQGVTWQLTSKQSFVSLRKAARRVSAGLPDDFTKALEAFLDEFR